MVPRVRRQGASNRPFVAAHGISRVYRIVTTPPLHRELAARAEASPDRRLQLRIAAAVDGGGIVSPAAAVIERGRLVAVGDPRRLGVGAAGAIDLPTMAVLPPLVNAHAHLDLTLVGAISPAGGFAAWAGEVRRRRPEGFEAVAAAVEEGVRRAIAGGTGFIGDIAGRFGLDAAAALRRAAAAAGLEGVSYIEVFGIGRSTERGVEFVRRLPEAAPREEAGVRLGVSPHAPYSCGDEVYAAAAESGLPATTHLAETLEELRFVRDGEGPFVDLLKEVGAWTPQIRGWGVGPVERLRHQLVRGRFSAVHLNHLDEAEIAMLAAAAAAESPGPTAVYCPRASAFFGHDLAGAGRHPYRDLLAAGVPVALGTDSAVVLGESATLSVLDEMRLLARRDGTDPRVLVAMATDHGAAAIGLDPMRVRFPAAGTADGLVGVDLGPRAGDLRGEAILATLLAGDRPCEWVWRARRSGSA